MPQNSVKGLKLLIVKLNGITGLQQPYSNNNEQIMNFSYTWCTVAVVFAAFMCIIESQLERCIISPTGRTGLIVIVDLSLSHIKWAAAATYVLLNQAHCIFARLGRIFLSFQNPCCQQKSFYPLLFFCLYPFSMRTFPVTSPPALFSLASAFCCSQHATCTCDQMFVTAVTPRLHLHMCCTWT